MRRKPRSAELQQLENLLGKEIIRRLEEKCGRGLQTWSALKQVLAEVLQQARAEGMAIRMGETPLLQPRIVCLLSIDGGNIKLRARVETSVKKQQKQPARVLSMVEHKARKAE
jgi:hypothetical protein